MEEVFKTIYKILRTLERAMDTEEPFLPTAEQLGISEPRWKHIIEMLLDQKAEIADICRSTMAL